MQDEYFVYVSGYYRSNSVLSVLLKFGSVEDTR